MNLVDIVIWTDKNEILLSSNMEEVMNNFKKYRSEVLARPNIIAQLVTFQNFTGGELGMSYQNSILE